MTKDETLRLALEALENLFGIPDKWTGEGGGDVAVWRLGGSYRAQEAMTAIKSALEAKDEPVPVAIVEVFGKDWRLDYMALPVGKHKLYAQQYLYTTPPQRKPLTDEEITLIIADCASSHQHTDIHLARAIEAAHGIKGEA
jgi:hypothetical protein